MPMRPGAAAAGSRAVAAAAATGAEGGRAGPGWVGRGRCAPGTASAPAEPGPGGLRKGLG